MWRFKGASVFLVLAALFFSAGPAKCASNLPVENQIYNELEYLEVNGLLESSMLSSKPISRKELKEYIRQAEDKIRLSGKIADTRHLVTINRIKKEFGTEKGAKSFIKPLSNIYLKTAYSGKDSYFLDINNNGDRYAKGLGVRAGFTSEAEFGDTLFASITPEARAQGSQDSVRGEVLRGYLNLELDTVEIQAGRDSLWWGPGYHGALLVSNNAKPFDMVKLTTSHPVVLPWFFSRLGLFKPTIFLTRLEEDRDFPRANLLGMRFHFKPTRAFQIGFNRTFMFGGKGRRSLESSDWIKVFVASDSAEHMSSPVNGNQLASIDASYVYVNERRHFFLPFSGAKLYTEWGAEDSSGKTKTPSNRANIYGAYIAEPLFVKNTDLRVEWANTARHSLNTLQWYTHLIYRSGYTYEGRTIGHHMGSDAQDLFVRAQYHAPSGAVIGLEADSERTGVHTSGAKRRHVAADISFPATDNLIISGTAGLEKDYGSPSVYPVLVFNINFFI